jgi:signal transduction histidine kinase
MAYAGSSSLKRKLCPVASPQCRVDEYISLQSMMTEMATTFINLPLGQVDVAIDDALRRMAELVDADRSYLFEYDFDSGICRNTHEWCALGVEPQIKELQAVPLALMMDWVCSHRKGEAMNIVDVEALPPSGVKELLQPQNVTSLLSVPMMNSDECLGFVGFDYVRKRHECDQREYHLLKLFANLIVNVFRRQRMETERRELQRQFLNAQKMESVGRLAGGVAHDFNNMLSVIIGYAELMRARYDDQSADSEDLDEILNAALHAREISGKLLTFANRQKIEPREVNLNSAVSEMYKFLTKMLDRSIELDWHPSDIIPSVLIDPSQIDQILMNLCINARDALADGGRIDIRVGLRYIDDNYCAARSYARPGSYAFISVADNGSGIDPAIKDKIFEPFFTTKAIDCGSGLGLATVHGIVKQNEGFIEIESELGRGTRFEVYLPEYEKAEELPPHADEEFEAPQLSIPPATIIVVDDEVGIVNSVCGILAHCGHTAHPATSASMALSLAEELGESLELIITDYSMPEMDGGELLKRARELAPAAKAIWMSGYPLKALRERGVIAEGVPFINKPFSKSELLNLLACVLLER